MRMDTARGRTALRLLRGVAMAALATFPGMLLLAAAVVLTPISDGALLFCNQLLKAACVLLGVCAAVPAGGERGLLVGAAVGALYMLAGYGLYCFLEGGSAWNTLAVELLAGVALGALFGALRANMKPRRRAGLRRRTPGAPPLDPA